MMNTKVVAGGLAVVLLGGGLAAGLAGATSGGGSSNKDVGTPPDGDPAQTVAMRCAGDSCDLVFIPPSAATVHPLGLDVQLLRADATEAVLTVAGQAVTVTPDRPVRAQGATFTLIGPPNPLVKLHISKS
jgi:hypothetical protein